MIFPPDSEIREFAAYYIRAIKIFREEFKNSVGREPSEFELTDFSKMGIIPFGFVPKQNGFSKQSQDHTSASQNSSVNKENTNPPAQTKDQPAQQRTTESRTGWKSEVLRLLNEFPQNLERKSQSRIVIVKEIPHDRWNDVKKGFESEGWKYDWKGKAFLISEEMKA